MGTQETRQNRRPTRTEKRRAHIENYTAREQDGTITPGQKKDLDTARAAEAKRKRPDYIPRGAKRFGRIFNDPNGAPRD